jgi:hypothetical protein
MFSIPFTFQPIPHMTLRLFNVKRIHIFPMYWTDLVDRKKEETIITNEVQIRLNIKIK